MTEREVQASCHVSHASVRGRQANISLAHLAWFINHPPIPKPARAEWARELKVHESRTATRRESRAMADEAAGYIEGMRATLDAWTTTSPTSVNAETITAALRRCVHAITLDAANDTASIDLRTLPVLASGPAFQIMERVTITLSR